MEVPEFEFEVLDLRDEASQRQFLQDLKDAGVEIEQEDEDDDIL